MNPFRSWLRTNQGIGAVLTLIFGAYLLLLRLSPWVHRELQDGFTLGFFPSFAVVLMMLLTVAMIFDGRRKLVDLQSKGVTLKQLFFLLLFLVGNWVYFQLAVEIGFLLVSPVFLLVAMVSLGMRPWSAALAAGVAITLIVYGVFRLLGVELPTGLLPF